MSEWAKLHHEVRARVSRRINENNSYSLFSIVRETCESDIERMMACQLADLFCPDNYNDTVLFNTMRLCEHYRCSGAFTLALVEQHHKEWRSDTDCLWNYGPRMRCAIYPQVQMWQIRVDFLIIATDWTFEPQNAMLVVECDGHDFHERTKAQAARDRRRDRLLTAAGIPFMRFTGSEIYRDSMACMIEVENLLWRQLHPQSQHDRYPPREDDSKEYQSDFAIEDDGE